MDKFDIFMDQMKTLGPQEVNGLLSGFKIVCVCPNCPTYNECAGRKEGLLYCLLGRSKDCLLDELGCICSECPVWVDIELKNTYYCTRGSEKQLRQPMV